MRREDYAADRRRAAYFWEARRHEIVVASEFGPDGTPTHKAFREIAVPYVLHARPYRAGDFRCFAITIEAGETPIWEHFVIEPAGKAPYEGLLFGRRFPDGREELVVVLPDGNPIPCSSTREARMAIAEGAALLA